MTRSRARGSSADAEGRDRPADLLNRAKESARRNYETALKQNPYWLGRLQTEHLFDQNPALLLHRAERIDALTAQSVQDAFRKYFPIDRHTVVTLVPAEIAAQRSVAPPADRELDDDVG